MCKLHKYPDTQGSLRAAKVDFEPVSRSIPLHACSGIIRILVYLKAYQLAAGLPDRYPQGPNFASCDWIPFLDTRESLSRYGSNFNDRSVALSLYALIDSLARYRVQASDYGLHDYTTKCFAFILYNHSNL